MSAGRKSFWWGMFVGAIISSCCFLLYNNHFVPYFTRSNNVDQLSHYSNPSAKIHLNLSFSDSVASNLQNNNNNNNNNDFRNKLSESNERFTKRSPNDAVGIYESNLQRAKGFKNTDGFKNEGKNPQLNENSKTSLVEEPPKEQLNTTSLRARCAAKFGKRQFLPESLKRLPPMLYTFPGSGNTWCRMLIEHATGVYTGSVYNDDSLLKVLPGEFTCNWQVSVVKVHPHTHKAEALIAGGFGSDNNKCNRGGVKRFQRAILVIRDPFDSIWSEFQRRISQSHVAGVRKDTFNWHRWQANAASLSHAYLEMWTLEHSAVERVFRPEDILYIRYEDLKDNSKRLSTLEQIVTFLRFPPSSKERLQCAFELSNNRETHRTIDKSLFMTKLEAYRRDIACRMWALFGIYASRHNYKPWNNFDCTGYQPIPRVNVGPQGEYDMKWVKPGGKLVDFRQNMTIDELTREQEIIRTRQIQGGAGSVMRNGRRHQSRKKSPGYAVH